MKIIIDIIEINNFEIRIYKDREMILKTEEKSIDKINLFIRKMADIEKEKGGMFVEPLTSSRNCRIEIWENCDEILEKVNMLLNQPRPDSEIPFHKYYIDIEDCFSKQKLEFYKINEKDRNLDSIYKSYPATIEQIRKLSEWILGAIYPKFYIFRENLIDEIVDFVTTPDNKYMLKKMLQLKELGSNPSESISVIFSSDYIRARAITIRNKNNVVWIPTHSNIYPVFLKDEVKYRNLIKYSDSEWLIEMDFDQLKNFYKKIIIEQRKRR